MTKLINSIDRSLREPGRTGDPGWHVGSHEHPLSGGRLSAVLRTGGGVPPLGRRRQRICRPHVQLGPERSRPPSPGRRGRGAPAAWSVATCMNGPGDVLVELAELMVDTVAHADWAHVPEERHRRHDRLRDHRPRGHREAQGLVARGSYHGAVPWCTPVSRGRDDRGPRPSHPFRLQRRCRAWKRRSTQAGYDLAAIIVTAFRHDIGRDQEMPTAPLPSGRAALRLCTAPRSSSTTCARASASILAEAGSRSAFGPTSAPGARRSPTAILWPPSQGTTGSARLRRRSTSRDRSGTARSPWRLRWRPSRRCATRRRLPT